MVGDAVVGERMDKNIQPFAVQHQPRHQGREFFTRESHLIHRDRMRSDRLVVPTSELSAKALTDRPAHTLGEASGLRMVIHVSVISLDPGKISKYPVHDFPILSGSATGTFAVPRPRARCINTMSTQLPNF